MIKVNGQEMAFTAGTTIASLLENMNFSLNRVAVECNGEIVPGRRLSERMVEDNDVLEVVSFVGGG